MNDVPKFRLYGEGDPVIEEIIQPKLPLRQWGDLTADEKQTAFQELKNRGWVESYSEEVLDTIGCLNDAYLRQCPGRNLHAIEPRHDYNRPGRGNKSERIKAAIEDFRHIFLREESDSIVLQMLSILCLIYIDNHYYSRAIEEEDRKEREKLVDQAFEKFDVLADCLNHIFEQFAVNQLVTRNGFVPRQDEKIVENIYVPTLKVLSDPKWQSVSSDLAKMFDDYRDENYPECITKAHSAVQRFLQVLVGEEGKSGKGEVRKLFDKAKREGYISTNQFTEGIISGIKNFIPSERANNSTAKPSLKDATSSDALLMMNVVMVFLQHCLQNTK